MICNKALNQNNKLLQLDLQIYLIDSTSKQSSDFLSLSLDILVQDRKKRNEIPHSHTIHTAWNNEETFF